MRINVLRVGNWRVRNVFESDNGVSHEALSSYMYKLSDHGPCGHYPILRWSPLSRLSDTQLQRNVQGS